MGRPNKPGYFADRSCWRAMVHGKRKYFCKGIPPDQKPQREGIPRVVWDEMDKLVDLAEARSTAGNDPTVYWLIQQYLEWLEAEVLVGRLENKQHLNAVCHTNLLLALSGKGSKRAKVLTTDDLDEFFARLRVEPLERTGGVPSGHYLHNVGKTVRHLMNWAARPIAGRVPARLVYPNPVDGYKFPGQPGAVRGYVEAQVVRRFLRWAWGVARWEDNTRRYSRARGVPRARPEFDPATRLKPPDHLLACLKRRFDRLYLLMLRFQRLTGCRPGEACLLEWAEIAPPPPAAGLAWEPMVITVRPEKVKTRKMTTRARKIHVTPPVARLLRVIHRLPGHHPVYVFTHMRGPGADARGQVDPLAGEPWPDGSSASAKLTKLRDRAVALGLEGLERLGPRKLVAYANRHGYASEGSSLGFSDEQIAEQLGNTPEVMRRVYAHSVDEAAAQRAGEIAEKRRRVVRRGGRGDGV
jgi:integrase